MKDVCTSIISVIACAALCLLVICNYGISQYREDQENCLNAAKTFVDRVVDADEVEDYFITELNNTVAACHGIYTTQVNKYTNVSNATPDGKTYISEYLGKVTDNLVTGDRIEVVINVVRYPNSMSIMAGLVGILGHNLRMFKVSGTVR